MLANRLSLTLPSLRQEIFSISVRNISVSCIQCRKNHFMEPRVPKRWPVYNDRVYPPQEIEAKPRPAYVCHVRANFKYSPWKMWYIAMFVRGMSVDEACRQLDFVQRKGAAVVKNTILEAQELAVQKNNVEFRSNLWVAESFVGKGLVIKGIRRHARKMIGHIEYFHCHYYVRLEEGSPPADFRKHVSYQPDGPTLLQRWIQERRDMRIVGTF